MDFRTHDRFLAWRGVTPGTECDLCNGAGVRMYSSTATFYGGIGGRTMTRSVCDRCWGTGSSIKQGVNIKELTLQVHDIKRILEELKKEEL